MLSEQISWCRSASGCTSLLPELFDGSHGQKEPVCVGIQTAKPDAFVEQLCAIVLGIDQPNRCRGRLVYLPGGRAYHESTTPQRSANPLILADSTDNEEAQVKPIAGGSYQQAGTKEERRHDPEQTNENGRFTETSVLDSTSNTKAWHHPRLCGNPILLL